MVLYVCPNPCQFHILVFYSLAFTDIVWQKVFVSLSVNISLFKQIMWINVNYQLKLPLFEQVMWTTLKCCCRCLLSGCLDLLSSFCSCWRQVVVLLSNWTAQLYIVHRCSSFSHYFLRGLQFIHNCASNLDIFGVAIVCLWSQRQWKMQFFPKAVVFMKLPVFVRCSSGLLGV